MYNRIQEAGLLINGDKGWETAIKSYFSGFKKIKNK